MAEHGPSEKAVGAAAASLKDKRTFAAGLANQDEAALGFMAFDALAAAHHPALGLDRSVCLRDVVELIAEQDFDLLSRDDLIAVLTRLFVAGPSSAEGQA